MKKSRVLLWFVVIAISVTGVALYLMAPGSEDELPNPMNGVFRELHGVFSALAIFTFGYLFADHVQKKLAKHKKHWNLHLWDGYLHLAVWALLVVSGLLLYYPPEVMETLAINTVKIHWYLGLLLMSLFPLHFWRKALKRYQVLRHKKIQSRQSSDRR